MPYHYNDFVAGQESSDEDACPNELVYHLGQLLGISLVHISRALSVVNPPVRVFENHLILEQGALHLIEDKLSFIILRETREALNQHDAVWSTSTITV